MPHVWRRPWPDPVLYEQELRALVPHLNIPIIGKEAICAWFYAHGFSARKGGPPRWKTLTTWQQRAGEPFVYWVPRYGPNLGIPHTTTLIVTRWVLCQACKVAGKQYAGYVPEPIWEKKKARDILSRSVTNDAVSVPYKPAP